MPIPAPWFAVAISTTLINGLILGVIARRERNASLGTWALAWGTWALAGVPLMLMVGDAPGLVASLACGSLWVVSTALFLAGCYRMDGQRLPIGWIVVAALAVLLAVALGVGPGGELGMLPLVFFQCFGLVVAGVQILRRERGRLGGSIGGVALVLLGLHVLDAPLLATDSELMPWGFVLATALQLVAALGMVTLYYERARERLLETELVLERNAHIRDLGRAVASVAHDFNNLLAIMQGQLDLHRTAEDERERERSLDSFQNAIEQSRRFTSLLLSAGKEPREDQRQDVDLREVISAQLELLRQAMPSRIRLQFRCVDEPVMAMVDRRLLEQVVLNLVTNARDAISGEGEIDVELESVSEPERRVSIRVRDTGEGIDEQMMAKMFQPFFSTKQPGKGTGLGLSSVQGAVSQLGGSVHVASSPQEGSCFEVLFPPA